MISRAGVLVCLCAGVWALVLLAAVGVLSKSSPPLSATSHHPVAIAGSAEMIRAAEGALDLLRDNAPDDHAYVIRWTQRIEQYGRTCADVESSRIYLAGRTYNASPQWLASVLVHEARHIELYQQQREYGGQDEELDCQRLQLDTLRRLRGTHDEIRWLEAQNGKHFDVNGDGVFDERDAELQDW